MLSKDRIKVHLEKGETDTDTVYACEEFVKNCMEKHLPCKYE